MSTVYLIWNDEDYYGPDFVSAWATTFSVGAVERRPNADYVEAVQKHGLTPSTDWPHFVSEAEVRS